MKNGIIIVVAILIFSVFPEISFSETSFSEKTEIVLDFSFKEPVIEENNGEYSVKIPDLPSASVENVKLPVKPISVLLPQRTGVKNIQIFTSDRIVIGDGYTLEKGKPLALLGKINEKREGAKQGIYPGKLYSKVGVYNFRGYSILLLNLYPVHYVPSNGEIFYYKHMRVKIETKNKPISPLFRGLKRDAELVKKMVINPEMTATYVQKPIRKYGSLNPSESHEYVIITSRELAPAWQDFVEYKRDKGINATVVTTEEIYSNPAYWSIRPRFNDKQAKIRNFIKDAYMNWETEYVLLGGDADTDNRKENIIPARLLYATCVGLPLGDGEELEGYIPSDLYYACLDGNFNTDGDKKWGENATGNSVSNEDEADLFAEVYVGRACVDNVEEVENFVRKTIAYEEMNHSYFRNVLMLGEELGFEGIAYWGGNYMDDLLSHIPDWYNVERLYERDNEWDASVLVEYLRDGVHIINHLGHGWTIHAMKMSSSDVEYIANNLTFFVYSQTCLAGSFDNWAPDDYYYEQDCLAEALTVETPYGAFAAIMNSRYGLGRHNSTDSPGQRYHAAFLDALFKDGIRELGKANQISKEAMAWRIDENGMRWICYETNLFGDPQLRIKGPETNEANVKVRIVEPSPGIYLFNKKILSFRKPIIFGNITVIAEAYSEEGISKVEFYLDNEMKSVDSTPPYSWMLDESGRHFIKAIAYTTSGIKDSDGIEVWIFGS